MDNEELTNEELTTEEHLSVIEDWLSYYRETYQEHKKLFRFLCVACCLGYVPEFLFSVFVERVG